MDSINTSKTTSAFKKYLPGGGILAAAILIFWATCHKSSPAAATFPNKPDTSDVYALYINRFGGPIMGGPVKRVIAAVYKEVAIDSQTIKKQWAADTTWFIPVADTLRDSSNKVYPHYKLDSLKKPIINVTFNLIPNRFVQPVTIAPR